MKVKDYFVSDLIDQIAVERAQAAKAVTMVQLARDYIDSETANSASSYIDSKPLRAILGMLDEQEERKQVLNAPYTDELEEAANGMESEEEEADE